MSDQAEQLRWRLKQRHQAMKAKVISVASGKGGVGKSNVTLNVAMELASSGKQVLIIDLDLGMGNIDILLGLSPELHMADLFQRSMPLRHIIESGGENLSYIAGGSSLSRLLHVDEGQFRYFIQQFETLLYDYDYIFFDMGAGANEESLQFITAADETFIVTTSEPTSLTDAYSMMKHIFAVDPDMKVSLIMNRALSEKQGWKAVERIQTVLSRFLGKEVKALGVLPEDKSVMKAVHRQKPFISEFPSSKAGHSLKKLVRTYLKEAEAGTESSFLQKLKRLVTER